MKFALPTADYPPIEGGISTLALNLARELAGFDHDVTVIAPRFPDMDAFDTTEPYTVRRFGGYGLGWLRYFPMRAAAAEAIRNSDCTIAVNVAYGGLMARRLGARYLVPAYGYEFLKFRNNSIVSSLLRSVYAGSVAVVAISDFTASKLRDFGVEPGKIVTVHPGAPPARHASPDATQRVAAALDGFDHVILAVGRFIPRKGHATLIRAMPRILEAHGNAGLVLVGRGPRLDPARALAQSLGVSDRVVFAGYASDDELAAYYAACDVFALPTGEPDHKHVEGFGLVFSEAHAYGKPVVGGRSGGVVDAVLDGETGLLVDPEDVTATADAVSRLLADKALRESLGARGRKRVEHELNWTAFTRQIIELAQDPAT